MEAHKVRATHAWRQGQQQEKVTKVLICKVAGGLPHLLPIVAAHNVSLSSWCHGHLMQQAAAATMP
jgi:hypothetical protein